MVYLTSKQSKGHTYLYLVEDAWVNGRSKHIFQKSLGREDEIKNAGISNLLSTKKGLRIETEELTFGISAALWRVAKEIGLVDVIDGVLGPKRHQNLTLGQYLVVAVINRCADPCSKSRLGKWFARDWLSTQLAVDPKVLNAQTYWNHFQQFAFETSESGEEGGAVGQIELAVGKAVVERFGLDLSGVLYDSTNFFTFSQGGRDKAHGNGSTILRFGHNNEGRNGNRLAAYWVLCTRDTGVPLMHETYAGNRQDAEVFRSVPPRVACRLKALGGDPANVTLVFDNGNLSPEGFKALEDAKLKYVASRRPSEHKELLHVPSKQFTDCTMPNGKKVQYYATTAHIYKGDRQAYVVLDPAAHKKRLAEFRFKLARKVREIKAYFQDEGRLDPATIAGKRGQGQKWLERAAVEEKVAEMARQAPFKGIITFAVTGPAKVTPESKRHLTLSVAVDAKARKWHEETLGKSVIFTNRDDWTPEAVIWAYREKYVVEHAFERMKCPSSIAVRPMYHHADPCVRAHVFTCVLALLLQSLLRLKLARKGIFTSYDRILDALRAVEVTKVFPTPEAKPIVKLNRTRGLSATIVKALGLNHLFR